MLRSRWSLPAALLALGCGPSGGPERGEVAGAQPQAQAPDFARDIAPLIHAKCSGCHHEGGPGPFALVDYGQVRDHGEQLVEVTASGFMPPWLPEPGSMAFVGADERALSEAERQQLADWVAAGMPEGDRSATPPAPHYEPGWQLGEPDLVLEAPAGYTLPADGADIYRNFVITVPSGPPRFVKATELLPGNPQVVHHAVMRVDESGEAGRLDAAEKEEVGYDGMVFGGARMPGGRFIGWTPGKQPNPGSDARSWPLVPGTELVVQVHMRPSGKPEPIQPRVGLHFAAAPPSEPGLAMLLSSSALDIPPGESDYRVQDSLELVADVELLSIYPHAHYIGKRMRATARLPDGSELELIRIDDWDFNWQDQYRYVDPIALPRGTVVHMDYSFDNSAANPRNPSSPPQRVVYGPASTDEMAELILELEPRQPQDYARLDASFMRKWLDDQITAYEHALVGEADAGTAETLAGLGALLARAGRFDEALARYEASLARADRAATRVELALLLVELDRAEVAETQLDAAIAVDPDYARTYLVRGNWRRSAGRYDEAKRDYERVLALDPSSPEAHNNLGVTHEKLGEFEAAAAHFAKAAELAPGRALFQQNRGRALEAAGRYDEALAAYRAALSRDARSLRAMRGVAWLLATHPDPARRDPAEALRIADAGGRMTQGRSPEILEALAAALAASDRFDTAQAALSQALELVRSAGRDDLAARYEAELARLARGELLLVKPPARADTAP